MAEKEFELSENAQVALGVNKDYSLRGKADEKPVTESVQQAKPENDMRESATVNLGEAFKNKQKEKEVSKPRNEQQSGSESSNNKKSGKEENPKNEKTDEVITPFDFQKELIEKVYPRFKDKDEESQRQFLADTTNYDKFMASNTQKSQELAEAKREHDNFVSKVGSGKTVEAYKALTSHPEFQTFLDATDDFFDGKEINPVRKYFESLAEAVPKIEQHSKEQTALLEKQADLSLREELIDLYDIDKSYKGDEKRVNELADYAVKNAVTLIQAHNLLSAEKLATQVKTDTETIAALNKKISNLEKEVKEKNKRLDDQEKFFTPNGTSSIDTKQQDFKIKNAPNMSAMDEAERRVRRRLGVEN